MILHGPCHMTDGLPTSSLPHARARTTGQAQPGNALSLTNNKTRASSHDNRAYETLLADQEIAHDFRKRKPAGRPSRRAPANPAKPRRSVEDVFALSGHAVVQGAVNNRAESAKFLRKEGVAGLEVP